MVSASSSWPGFPKWLSVTWKYKPNGPFSPSDCFLCFISAIERKLQYSPKHTVMVPTVNNLALLIYLNGLLFQIRYQTLATFSDVFSGSDPMSFALREIIRSRPRSLLCWQISLWNQPRFIYPRVFCTMSLSQSLNLEIWMVPTGYFL